MEQIRNSSVALLLVLFLLSGSAVKIYGAVEFLNIGVGARAISLGEAFVGKADDFTAAYWNPGSIGFQESISAGAFYSGYYEDISFTHLAGLYPAGNSGVFGLSFTYTGTSLPFTEVKDDGSLVDNGKTYSCYDMDFALSYGRKLNDNMGAGITGKYIVSKIEEEKGGAVAFDLGAKWEHLLDDQVSLGLAAVNLGSKIKYIQQSENLPAGIKFGGAFDIYGSEDSQHELSLLQGNAFYFSGMYNLGLGTEYSYNRMFFGRLGYLYEPGKSQISIGAGADYQLFRKELIFNFVYSIVPNISNIYAADLSLKF